MAGDPPVESSTTPATPVPGRRSASLAAALMAGGLAAWLAAAASIDSGRIGVVLDDGIYLVSARALRDGEGYRLPSRPGSPPPKYPIGLPALIAGGLWLTPGPPSAGRDAAVARGVVLIGALAAFVGAFVWLRRIRVAPVAAALVILAWAFHHVTLVGCGSTIFSDLPFAALSFLLLSRWAGRGRRPAAGIFSSAPAAALDGAIAGLGYLVRGNGLTLLVGSAAAAWVGPNRRAGLLGLVVGAALVIGPLAALATGPDRAVPSGDYRLELRAGWSSPEAGARIVARNLRSIMLEFPLRVVAPNTNYTAPLVRWLSEHPASMLAAQLGASALVGLGAWTLARRSSRRELPAWVHVAGTLAIFAVWPWNSILDRFLLGLMPMVLLAFGVGVGEASRAVGLGATGRRAVVGLALAVSAAGSLSVAGRAVTLFHTDGRQWRGGSHRSSLDAALSHIAGHLEPDAVVAAMWPETVFLSTGRQAVPIAEDDDVMLERFGRRDRLDLWRAQVPGRPFYLLVRVGDEDPRRVDVRQEAAVAPEATEVYRTPDGRYRLVRLAPRG